MGAGEDHSIEGELRAKIVKLLPRMSLCNQQDKDKVSPVVPTLFYRLSIK
jgi:hypothetical protein